MSCLSWNSRGVGNPKTVHDLHQMVQKKLTSFDFLIETKCKRDKIEAFEHRLRLENIFAIDCKGLSGGIAFLWRDDIEAVVTSYTQNHISILVKGAQEGNGMTPNWVLWQYYYCQEEG